MKKHVFTIALLCCSVQAFAQSKQLSKWFCAPNELNLQNTTQALKNYTTTGYAGTGAYNAWYENGTLLFYVMNMTVSGVTKPYVFKADHSIMGSISVSWYGNAPAHGEIAIIPHMSNFSDPCSHKFWVLTSLKSAGSTGGIIGITEVDFDPASTPVASGYLMQTDRADIPFAVSPLDANGDRHIYIGQSTSTNMLSKTKIDLAGNIYTPIYYSGYTTGAGEMELSNDGQQLAALDAGGDITLISLSSVTHGPVSAVSIGVSGSVNGLEFDNTGKLFYSKTGMSGTTNISGIYAYDNSTTLSTFISGSASYGSGMLEKAFEDGTVTPYIICGNSTSVCRFDPAATPSAALDVSWTRSIPGLNMPDQIDGEDVDDKMITITKPNPYRHSCTPVNYTAYIRVHPYIQQFYGTDYSLHMEEFDHVSTHTWGSPTSPLPSSLPLSQTSQQFYFSLSTLGTRSFAIVFQKIGSPACSTRRQFSLYFDPCPVKGTFTSSPGYLSASKVSITTIPDFPTEEQAASGFGNTWTVQELDPETNMPIYNVQDATCWATAAGEGTTFPGFEPETTDYTVDALTCGSSAGGFLVGHTYRIVRTVWETGVDPVEYADIFTIDTPMPPPAPGMTASIKKSDENTQVVIYPNPSKGSFRISLPASVQSAEAQIITITGNVADVFSIKGSTHSYTPSAQLAQGIYLLKVSSNGMQYITRLLVE